MQGLHSQPESRQQFDSIDRGSAAPAFQAWEHSIPSPDANDVLRKFDRNTCWVAAGLLGTLLLAALAFVVLLPERHAMTAVLSERASPSEDSEAKAQNDAELAASHRDALQAQQKRRLLELWHRSLAKSEVPKSWAIFSRQEKGKKAVSRARKKEP